MADGVSPTVYEGTAGEGRGASGTSGVRLVSASSLVAATLAVAAVSGPARPSEPVCVACLGVRTGPPMVVRGPFPDELDNHFVALELPGGAFRGFSANGATYAIDGPDVRAMGGRRREVLAPGPAGSSSGCGRWLNGVVRSAGTVYGLVHQESGCDYDRGQTAKSMAIATSDDDGLTWTDLGLILTGADAPKAGAITGEGDCTMVDGADGYLYAYCLRNTDWQTIVARAPVADPGPGNWRKYKDGRFDADAIGGAATAIGFRGTASGYIRDFGSVATIAIDPWFKGLRLSLSADKANFTDLDDPLLPIDAADWQRPADTGLIAYVSLVDPADGTNTVGRNFLIAYVYIPPGKDFADRYLVFQEVRLAMEPAPELATAGVALTRWKDAGTGLYRTTSAPVVDAGYTLDAPLGYLLTRAGDGNLTVELADCVADRPGGADYLLAVDGECTGGYARLATAGWAYAEPRAGTNPLYRCYAEAAGSHFASTASDCEGLGAVDRRLGYVLAE